MSFKIEKASKASSNAPIKALLYGDSGAGKTTLAVTGPGPVLVLLTERQAITSINASNPEADIIYVNTAQDVRNVVGALRNGDKSLAKYKTLVVDSLTETQRLIQDDILKKARRDTMQLQDYGKLADATKGLIRTLRDLPINVICTALMEHDNEEATGKRHYSPIFIGKKTGREIAQWFTIIGYLYRRDVKEENERVSQRYVMFDGPSTVLCKIANPLEGIIKDPNFTTIIQSIQQYKG